MKSKEEKDTLRTETQDEPKSKLHRISMNPFIGQTTEIENIRYIIPHPGYTLFYRHSLKKIEVVVLWDNRLKMGELKVIPKKE